MRASLLIVPMLVACGATEPVAVVKMDAWSPADTGLWGARPNCPEEQLLTEELGGEPSLEIRTERCAFVTVGQPLLSHIEVGDELELRVWHFALTPQEAVTATMAVAFGGREQFRTIEALPADSRLIDEILVAQDDAAAGDVLLFHLENHGTNSYHLLEINRL